jgi:hypothetical protein
MTILIKLLITVYTNGDSSNKNNILCYFLENISCVTKSYLPKKYRVL